MLCPIGKSNEKPPLQALAKWWEHVTICFVTVFTSAMTATGAIVFLISPGKNVVSVELFQSVENGRYSVASVQAVMILLVTAAVNIASMYLFSGKEKKRNVSGTDRCTKDV